MFDVMTRLRGAGSGHGLSRRAACRLVASGAVGVALAETGLASALTCKPKGKPCHAGGDCCSGLCSKKKGKRACGCIKNGGDCSTNSSLCCDTCVSNVCRPICKTTKDCPAGLTCQSLGPHNACLP